MDWKIFPIYNVVHDIYTRIAYLHIQIDKMRKFRPFEFSYKYCNVECGIHWTRTLQTQDPAAAVDAATHSQIASIIYGQHTTLVISTQNLPFPSNFAHLKNMTILLFRVMKSLVVVKRKGFFSFSKIFRVGKIANFFKNIFLFKRQTPSLVIFFYI